jgi:hypothetical protein
MEKIGLQDRESLIVEFYGDHGESGSPIVDEQGFVRAVVVEKEPDGHSYIYGVPIESLKHDE